MIYLNNSTKDYNTNLILENCVSKIKKEQITLFSLNFITKNFFNNIVVNLLFLLKYKIMFWLNNISRILNVIYSSRINKIVSLKFYNKFFLYTTTLIPKICKFDNMFLETTNNLNFFFKQNNAYTIFNLQNKKINFKLFKRYKKKVKLFLSVAKKYWNNIHKWNKAKKKKKRLIYSWVKRKFVKPKTSFFYRYPSDLWNFFKWSKLSNHLKPLVFSDKFKFFFNYKIKFFSKFFFWKNFNHIPKNIDLSCVPPKKKKIEQKFVKRTTFNKFYKKKYQKKPKRYKLIKKFFYIIKNLKSTCYISSYRYNPFYKKRRKLRRKTYKRQLRCRKPYKNYFLKKKKFTFFSFNKNFNKKKILTYFYKLKIKSYILCFISKQNINTKNKSFQTQKYRNQLYIILSKIIKQLYSNKTKHINISYTNSINVNLYKKAWVNLIFFHYLKIKIFKYKYLIKYLYKNNKLIKKTKISLKFYKKILNSKIISNLLVSDLTLCKTFFSKYILNKNILQSKYLILY